ncbi:acylphosphatase [Palleronia marisminoris]|uniref:acylphosphatase n=1 Tax=Palleronia marisminoris TaxID=315423 RepID=A0A1Y5RSY6_9RHOB|nr:acylphosphatase [Palleronia marisminoris]SFG50232.1 acylphosphatase [Palleronia marisminoris]SLN24751.1 Acylphosphatase [Palleronia marisminoris]
MAIARHVHVTGRVQGVGYRAWTRDEAQRLGLGGWVRNREDGSVEILLEGPEPAVAEMIQRLRDGPFAARVDDVQASDGIPEGAVDFEIRR